MSEKTLHVFTNGEEWVIAHDPADARKVYEEHMGSADPDEMEWEPRDDAKPFTFHGDAGDVRKTFGEWVAEKGRGYFANSNY